MLYKEYNNNTMTSSQFWGMIRSALRKQSRWWKPILAVKLDARRKYNGKNKRQKFEYQCANCLNWFPDKKIAVDHIIPAGTLTRKEDLPGFVERLFCEKNGLQVLCDGCHDSKTKKEKENRKCKKK